MSARRASIGAAGSASNRRRALVPALAALALLVNAAVARAETAEPQWTVTSISTPTNFAAGTTGTDAYLVTVKNTGGAPSDGSPVTITDELPSGLTLGTVGASAEDLLHETHFSCVLRSCTYNGVVDVDDTLVITVPVDVSESAPASLTNVVRVSGGGAPDGQMGTPTAISSTPAGFGIAPGGAATSLSSTQAGAHPDLTTSIAFNTVDATGSLSGDPKEVTDDLPPGFAGDLVDTQSCSTERFSVRECPVGSQVGVVTLTLTEYHKPRVTTLLPLYNLAPNPGELAKLAFYALNIFAVEGEVSLNPSNYGLKTVFHNTDESPAELDDVSLTLWGVPAQADHNALRWKEEGQGIGHFGLTSDAAPVPFFTNPTACSGEALDAVFTASSWESPEASVREAMSIGPILGCDGVEMEPTLTAVPTTNHAYAPSGLNLKTSIPQTYGNPEGLATSTLNRAVVTLPEGMTVNPSAGAGLAACTQAEYEAEPVQPVPGVGCPSTAKLGSVEIVTPSLKESVIGSVYAAEPYDNQFGSLLALYIVARIPERGVLVKVAGEVVPDPVTGRLVTTFSDLPPLPFSTFTFHFREGAIAPLVTPPLCGDYQVLAQLTPWSDLSDVLAPLIPPFAITSAFDGGACPSAGVPPFAPQVAAGTENNDAGSYSPLYMRITRNDGEQEITRFSSRLPAGLTANLTGVPFCSDADIALARTKSGAQEEAEPSCPAASQVGRTLAGAGVGSVLAWTAGKLYMAGPFNGAPFSIVSITSAKVGPFDLGTVVVRVALKINPTTAEVTVDGAASEPIPHIIKGIVIHVRDIRVYVDRPDYTLNPTSCQRMTLSATVGGSGADPANPADEVPVTVTSPFQAADCQALAFKPAFSVSTAGQASKKGGASLHVKLTYPKAPQGTQANIRSVKVDLPVQLPSRLETLQQACLAATFQANPGACPVASVVGHATALTPILPVPLMGPAYFVSYGGAKFPELVIVLQGYGVTIDLHGETFINKRTGITSSTFRTVPDQPVTSFELTLPQGNYSALGTNLPEADDYNLCGQKLAMPTAFVAQNGVEIHESTPVQITGCAKRLTPAQQLARALRACKGKRGGARATCERRARERYGRPKRKPSKK